MITKQKKRKPRIVHQLRDGVSYNSAAKAVDCSRNHLRLVCIGERESKTLIKKLELEGLLAHLETGIGSN